MVISQIRYDMSDDGYAEIDYSVHPAYQGMGLGTKLLNLSKNPACDELGAKKARGIVFRDNIASARSFDRSGFTLTRSESIQGRPCLIYDYNIEGEMND